MTEINEVIKIIEKMRKESVAKWKQQVSEDGRAFYEGESSVLSRLLVELKNKFINDINNNDNDKKGE